MIISGKVNYFKNKYQITNPDYVTSIDKQSYVLKNIPKYHLTKGITEKKYRLICDQVTKNLPKIDDWLNENFIKSNRMLNWNDAIFKLHNSNDAKNNQSESFRRLVFDEICANFLTLSESRKRIRQNKIKTFSELYQKIINDLPFKLTNGQVKSLSEINTDLKSDKRMFRIVQGDVGSGKTIISLLAIIKLLKANINVP